METTLCQVGLEPLAWCCCFSKAFSVAAKIHLLDNERWAGQGREPLEKAFSVLCPRAPPPTHTRQEPTLGGEHSCSFMVVGAVPLS